jgi:hypothetical protein
VAATLPQLPVALPPILTEAKRSGDFRNPIWVARKMLPGEKLVVERTLMELQQRDVPADVNKIRFHVGKTLNHWDNGRLGAAEKGQIIADYEFILRDFSEGQIAEACAEWLKASRFKPVPADIAGLASKAASRDQESVRRARVLLGLEPPRNWERPALPAPKEVDRPAARSMLAALTERMTGRKAIAAKDDQRRTAADVRRELAEQRGEGGRQLAENFRRAVSQPES